MISTSTVYFLKTQVWTEMNETRKERDRWTEKKTTTKKQNQMRSETNNDNIDMIQR